MTSRLQPQGPRALGQYGGAQCYGENGAGPRQLTSVLAPTPGGSAPACGTPGATVVASLTYDDAGRQITDGGRHMTYNGLDQLAAVDLPDGGHVVYAYGYDGQRIRVTDNSGAPPEHWMTPDLREQGGDYDQYVRVGDRVVARVHLHYNPDAPVATAGLSVTAARAVSALLLLALGLLALSGMRAAGRGHRLRPALASLLIAALLVPACAPTVGSQSPDLWAPQSITYFHTGFAAGPVLLTDDNGAVLDERRSEPFGQPIDSYSTAGGIKDSIDYRLEPTNILNKPTDARTGWSYHGARWMAPTTARWLTPDPPVKAPDGKFMAAPWALNPYQYVNQNPILYSDPDGKDVLRAEWESDPTLRNSSHAAPLAGDESTWTFKDGERLPKRMVDSADADKQPAQTHPSSAKLSAQDVLQMYGQLEFDPQGGGQVRAVILHPFAGAFARIAAREAKYWSARLDPLGAHNNAADAFRHAYWSALITTSYGADAAKAITDAHEVSQVGPVGENLMDLHNNAVGREIATDPAMHGLHLQLAISMAMASGRLQLHPYDIDGAALTTDYRRLTTPDPAVKGGPPATWYNSVRGY